MDSYEKMDIVQNELENFAMILMQKYELTEHAMVRAIVGVENTMRKAALARNAYTQAYSDNQQITNSIDPENAFTVPINKAEEQQENSQEAIDKTPEIVPMKKPTEIHNSTAVVIDKPEVEVTKNG